MSRIAHNNKKLTLRSAFGIRARLALLALIMVGPLMADRVRVLEDFRDRQLTRVNEDFAARVETTAGTQPALGISPSSVVSADAAAIVASTNQDIRSAYLQLGLVCLFVLLGALVVAERIIIRPIKLIADTAMQFGQGNWSARASYTHVPAEFVPLATAFNDMAAQLGEREREMLAAHDRLTVMASIDMLSGLANRRGLQSRLDFEWAKAQHIGGEVTLMMIDVDHFKAFNDTYGHLQGDACLARIGETLATIAREFSGFAGRYGGEEFCMLLPNADVATGHRTGEAVRAAVQALAIPHAAGIARRVTVSVGVASITPNPTALAKDLVEAADAALYAAKHRGRNLVAGHGFVSLEGVPLALAG